MARTPEDIQDELLVLRCQEGDDESLRALIDRWQPRLGRLAGRLTRDRDASRDIVQDAWLAIVRGIKRLDDPARFRSWAYRIVSNKCMDWTRRRVVRRKAAREREGTIENATDESDATDEVNGLRVALAHLPIDQRAILSLHYLDGMGLLEIARVLGVPVGTVKSRLYHARNRLREAMERVRT